MRKVKFNRRTKGYKVEQGVMEVDGKGK